MVLTDPPGTKSRNNSPSPNAYGDSSIQYGEEIIKTIEPSTFAKKRKDGKGRMSKADRRKLSPKVA